jgi:hypothetical protein
VALFGYALLASVRVPRVVTVGIVASPHPFDSAIASVQAASAKVRCVHRRRGNLNTAVRRSDGQTE